jgi:2-C-methyl-D-erythritol 4-phosphate cytidylyltransferase
MSTSWCGPLPRDVGVIVVAAGRGERLGGAPKQYREIAGVPMLLRSIRPFAAHPDVAHVAVVLSPADSARPPEWLAELLGGGLSVVAGGAERQDSVAAGLAALPDACAVVLVHDAARPFASSAVIGAVIERARAGHAAIAAVPVSDTLKRIASDGRTIERTVPREDLWRAQTPQGFPRAVLAAAHAAAKSSRGEQDAPATDDAALVERNGGSVTVVRDSATNFKITSADDLSLAEAWARLGSVQ